MGHFRNFGRVLAGLAFNTAAFGVQAGFCAPPSAPSTVVTIDPARILDTRVAVGVPGTTPVPAQGTIDVQVTGAGGVPANATGAIVTLTGTQATDATFITAFPAGTPRSTTSVLNVSPSADIANTVTMSIGAGGKISLFDNSGTVHLVADVTGYLLPPGSVTPTVMLLNTQAQSSGAGGYGVATITPTGSDNASSTVRYMIDTFNLAGATPGATHSFCGATITYQYLGLIHGFGASRHVCSRQQL